MIEATMRRLDAVDAVLKTAHSSWARHHWHQVRQALLRRLAQQGLTSS